MHIYDVKQIIHDFYNVRKVMSSILLMNICTIQPILSIFRLTEVITDFRIFYLALLKPEPPELNLLLEVVDCHYYLSTRCYFA